MNFWWSGDKTGLRRWITGLKGSKLLLTYMRRSRDVLAEGFCLLWTLASLKLLFKKLEPYHPMLIGSCVAALLPDGGIKSVKICPAEEQKATDPEIFCNSSHLRFLNLADFLCPAPTTASEVAMWYFEAPGGSCDFAISHPCGVGKVNKSGWASFYQWMRRLDWLICNDSCSSKMQWWCNFI